MAARLRRQKDRTPLPSMQGTAFAYINLSYEAKDLPVGWLEITRIGRKSSQLPSMLHALLMLSKGSQSTLYHLMIYALDV